MHLALLVLAALITATISGVLGMGGGIALLAVFTFLLPAAQVVPLHGVVQLASNFTRTLAFIKHARKEIVFIFTPAAVVGGLIAASIYTGDKLTWLKLAIGTLILLFLFVRRFKKPVESFPLAIYPLVGLVAGVASIFVGATGPLLAPFFLRNDLKKEEIVATKAACQIVIHLMKLPIFFSLGFDYAPHIPLLVALIAAVVIGTFLGKRLLEKVSQARFVQMFELLLLLIALQLVYRGMSSMI